MISSLVHQPCEVQLHLYSSDIFIHPPRPNSELPGDDQTLRGLIEIRVPSERTIQGVKVTLQGHQTLAIPERATPESAIIQTRYEDKVVLDKVVEITSETLRPVSSARGRGKGKGKERSSEANGPAEGGASGEAASASTEVVTGNGIHLEKGVHGFEFAFIIPASSAPFERGKFGRVRYTLTATALGAGRGKGNVMTSREILIILQVNADGGPVPLDIQYHDMHEALGAMSISLTSANLTVGGAATLSVYHPSPPPGLSVHVIRVFVEQTIELYSELRQSWMKLPPEKLRLWERGYMPNKDAAKQIDPEVTIQDSFWLRNDQNPLLPGHPGTAVIGGGFGVPTLAPYGATMHPGFTGPLGSSHSSSQTSPHHSHPGTPGGDRSIIGGNEAAAGANGTFAAEGYKVKAVFRLPDDNHMRPSTVRGSRADIRISHDLGVEVFFSRASVLDERPNSETFGKPKVQVFSMRRSTIIPSCFATYDTIHLPPYSLESPVSSRPPSPTSRGRMTPSALGPRQDASQSELDHWRLKQTLKAALGGHANAGSGASGLHSAERSHPSSTTASRNTSPSRQSNGNGGSSHNNNPQRHSSALSSTLGYFASHHGRRSRPASPTREASHSGAQSPGGSLHTAPSPLPALKRSGTPSLHALTPTHPHVHPSKPVVTFAVNTLGGSGSQSITNSFPTVTTAPASGTTTPRTLPANSPWATNNFPIHTSTSHDSCQCGRSTEELMEAEQRVLEGAPTAPGVWVDAHDEGALPPPWTPSRPSSPTMVTTALEGGQSRTRQEDVSGWYRGDDGLREGGRARGKIGEILDAMTLNDDGRPGDEHDRHRGVFPRHAVEEHDSDDDGGRL